MTYDILYNYILYLLYMTRMEHTCVWVVNTFIYEQHTNLHLVYDEDQHDSRLNSLSQVNVSEPLELPAVYLWNGQRFEENSNGQNHCWWMISSGSMLSFIHWGLWGSVYLISYGIILPYTYVYIYTYIYIYKCIYMYIHIYIYTYIHIYIYTYIRLCVMTYGI